MDTKDKQKLRKFIRNLHLIRGRHTELVSVYIPAGYDMNKIINHLQDEQGTASNIKDKTTRSHVIDSLEKMIRHLRLFKKTPDNGLAVFSGNISEREGQVKIEVFSVEPPKPLNTRSYRCDQTFQVDLLQEMLEINDVYGLIVIDRREGNVGLLKGTSITQLVGFTSDVPGKTTKGGQSQQRYARIREGAAKDFFKKVGNAANKEFLEMKTNLKGILVGGPGGTKEDFLSGSYLNQELKDKVVSVQDLSYTGDFGLQELVEKSQDTLAKESIAEEKKIMNDFLEMLGKETGKAAYGIKEVEQAFELGAVNILLVSEEFDEDLTEKFIEKAESTGAKIHIISTETREGVQLKDLGGIAAILKFAIS